MLNLKAYVEAPDIQAWKEEAQGLQQNLLLALRGQEWDEWDRSDITIFHQKIQQGLYPLPKNHPGDIFTEYSEPQLKRIENIANVIIENAQSDRVIHFACIFIFGKMNDCRFFIPVFKVKGKLNQTIFFDSNCREYKNWQDYLNSNRLPEGIYCYPRDGLYQTYENKVLVDFGTCPASIDDTATGVTFATSVSMASLFAVPKATPIVLEPSRKMRRLSDQLCRFLDTSQDLMDSNEWTDWRLTVNLAKGMAQSRVCEIVTRAAAAGEVEIEGQKISQSVNCVKNSEDDYNLLIPLVSHVTTSFVFFSNDILNEDGVKKIIENTQQEVLNRHCNDLSVPQIEEFFKLSEFVPRETQLDKNADKIKAINNIINKQAFYESLVTLNSDLEGHQVQFSFEELGLVNIDNELHIAPNKLAEISETDRRKILEATQKVDSSAMNDTTYWTDIEKILRKNRINMQYQRREAKELLKQMFNTDNLDTVEIGNKQIFKNMTPSELDRIIDVMRTSGQNFNGKLIKIVNEFAKMRKCDSPRDYCNYVEFVPKYLSELKGKKEDVYREELKAAKVNRDFKQLTFDKEYGIEGKRANHFMNQVFNYFDTNPVESYKALEEKYISLEKEVLPMNANISPNFASNASAVCHYFKHSVFGSKELTVEEYFNIASELVNEPLNQRSAKWNQQGNKKMIIFTNAINGAKGVVFETLPDGTRYLATLFYDDKVLNRPN